MRHRANCCLVTIVLFVVLLLTMLAIGAVTFNGYAGL